LASYRRFSLAFNLSIALACCIQCAPRCWAQGNFNADPEIKAADCPALPVFPQLAMTVVVSCQTSESVAVTMPLKPDPQGRAREKTVRGKYEFREYRIRALPEYAFDNLMQLVPIAGFVTEYSAKPTTITARKDDTWILISLSGDTYNLSVVREPEVSCTAPKDSGQISHEMQAHSRFAIYGLQFSADNHLVPESSSEILAALLDYLKQSADPRIFVESHKVTNGGSEDDDFEITRERANALVDWLVAHGIPAARLQAKPFGRMKPVTDNNTPTGMQCNERIELAKAAR
jgi:outer membrane protein OmpA-like peptidoglycan-associated protein